MSECEEENYSGEANKDWVALTLSLLLLIIVKRKFDSDFFSFFIFGEQLNGSTKKNILCQSLEYCCRW